MQIQGPNGRVVEVDDDNRLKAFAVSESEDKAINKQGGTHSIYFTVTPAGADDYFFYFENTGQSDLFLTDIRASSSVATTLFYEFVSGVPTYVTGTDAQATNRNLGSARALDAVIKFDTNITGLTNEGVLFFEECANANTRYKLSTTSNIIVPQGKAVAFRREAATGAIECVVSVVDGSAS